MERPTDPSLEQAAHEKRCWVRLTFACNNRCRFCHDSVVHDGSSVPSDEVKDQIRAGLDEGAQRLILSGGEPTIHRDFLDLVAYGKRSGYGWVQTISNGRMFSYPGFTAKAVDAGLDEVTLSMHGHNAALHDGLVGVEGAFQQSLTGLTKLKATGRVVVSVDVVLNDLNLPVLPELMEFYLAHGVREFDLLWLVPFGRAWDNRAELAVAPGAHQATFREAIRRARAAEAVVWTNRLPAALLEGVEDLIQDPHKLHDEVRGRRAELERWVQSGTPMRCQDPERCQGCFMEGFCTHLQALLAARAAGRYPALQVDLSGAPPPGAPWNQADLLRIAGADAGAAAAFARKLTPGPDRIEVVLAGPPVRDPREEDWGDGGPRIVAAAGRPEVLESLLAQPGLPLEIILDGSSAEWIAARAEDLSARGEPPTVSLRTFDRLSEVVAHGADPHRALSPLRPAPIGLAGVPVCLATWARRLPWPLLLGSGVVDPTGDVDLEAFTAHFIRHAYRVYSTRCASCRSRAQCPGLPINLVRRFGFGLAAPERVSGQG